MSRVPSMASMRGRRGRRSPVPAVVGATVTVVDDCHGKGGVGDPGMDLRSRAPEWRAMLVRASLTRKYAAVSTGTGAARPRAGRCRPAPGIGRRVRVLRRRDRGR